MVFALCAAIYFFGLFLAGWHRSAMAALRTGAAVTAAAIVGSLTLALLLKQEMLGQLLFAAFIAITGLPALALGLGLLAGGVVGLPATARGWPRWGALALASAVPLGLAGLWGSAEWSSHKAAKTLAVAQMETVRGTFGTSGVTVPLAPTLDIQWDCGTTSPCRAKLNRSPDGLLEVPNPVLLRLALMPVHDTCEGVTAPLNDCVLRSRLMDWCARRADVSNDAICTLPPSQRVFFWASDAVYHPAHDISDWVSIAALPFGSTSLDLRCDPTRDGLRITNGLSRLCGANWQIAPGVMAGLRLDRIEDALLADMAVQTAQSATAIWSGFVNN